MRTQNYAGAGPRKPFHLKSFVALLCGLARAVSYACMAQLTMNPCRPWSFQHEPWQAHFPEEGAVACWGRNPVSAKGVVHSQQTVFRATPHSSRTSISNRAGALELVFFCSLSSSANRVVVDLRLQPSLVSLLTVLTAARSLRVTVSSKGLNIIHYLGVTYLTYMEYMEFCAVQRIPCLS